MTGRDERPRWARKLSKDGRIEPNVRVMYKVVGVVAVLAVIWTIISRV